MPNTIKILFALTCTMIIYPVVDASGLTGQTIDNNLIWLSVKEVFIGVVIGFIARFFFHAISVCGEIVTLSLGLSADQLFMASMDRRVTVVEQFQLMLASLFFLAFNGHHIFIDGLVHSFNFAQLHETGLSFLALRDISYIAHEIIVFGIKLAAPVLGAIFISNISLGIIGRAVPQINVLVTSWPVNILLGFGVLFVSLPLFVWSLKGNLDWGAEVLFDFLKNM